MTAFDSSS